MSQIPPDPSWQQPPGYSNYPRANDPFGRPPGVYFDAIGAAWKLVQSDLSTWILTTLVGGFLIALVAGGCNIGINMLVYGSILNTGPFDLMKYLTAAALGIIPNMVVGIFSGSLLYMGLKQARSEPLNIGDLFIGFQCAVPLMIATLFVSLVTALGFVCLIIPGFFLIGALSFTPLLVIDRNMNPIEAMKASFNTLRADAWAMFALLFVAGLVVALGYCACFIGILFTLPVYFVTVGLTYNTYFPGAPVAYGNQYQIGVEPPR